MLKLASKDFLNKIKMFEIKNMTAHLFVFFRQKIMQKKHFREAFPLKLSVYNIITNVNILVRTPLLLSYEKWPVLKRKKTNKICIFPHFKNAPFFKNSSYYVSKKSCIDHK